MTSSLGQFTQERPPGTVVVVVVVVIVVVVDVDVVVVVDETRGTRGV